MSFFPNYKQWCIDPHEHLCIFFIGVDISSRTAACWVCTLLVLIDTSESVSRGAVPTYPPTRRLPLLLDLRVSSIAVSLMEREQGNSLSSAPSCLVTTDASANLYVPLGECRHCFNSLPGPLHKRIAIYINNQVWQHLPRLSHSD